MTSGGLIAEFRLLLLRRERLLALVMVLAGDSDFFWDFDLKLF